MLATYSVGFWDLTLEPTLQPPFGSILLEVLPRVAGAWVDTRAVRPTPRQAPRSTTFAGNGGHNDDRRLGTAAAVAYSESL